MTSHNIDNNSLAPTTNMAANVVDFGRLKELDWIAKTGVQIFTSFESALKLLPATTSDEKAKHFVDEVVKLSPEQQLDLTLNHFRWELWEALVEIAARAPPNSQAQDVLVESIILLKDGTNEMFKGLPRFHWSLRDNWNRSPAVDKEEGDEDWDEVDFNDSEWLNFNSFLAKLHTKQNIGWWNFAIWELRSGLEMPLSPEAGFPKPETRVRVASEWVIQSASRLLNDSLYHACQEYREGERGKGYPYRAGPLFSGASGFSLERWCFWKRRFGETKSEVDEDLHTVIDQAIHAMTQAETELGKLSAKSANKDLAIDDEPASSRNGSGCEDGTKKDEDCAQREGSAEHEDHLQHAEHAEPEVRLEE
ncbi:hypothetical protein GGS26DRAFT_600615 [Hypomontagnella submonticulosa]|nr:hypothetical protein GGS26DRAFT_600615 [Hypomontagnella submonticulosa]